MFRGLVLGHLAGAGVQEGWDGQRGERQAPANDGDDSDELLHKYSCVGSVIAPFQGEINKIYMKKAVWSMQIHQGCRRIVGA